MHLVQGVGRKIVQRDDTHNEGRERGGNLRVTHIGDVLFALDVQTMHFRVESFSHLAGGPGEVNNHPTGVNDIDFEVVRLQPVGDFIEISIGRAEPLSEFVCADPVMKVWRSRFLQALEELLKFALFLSRPAQLEQHVLQENVIVHDASIVLAFRLGTSIAA